MRKFSSYGLVEPELHYYVPRLELADFAYQQLLGDNPDKGGHYITVWAPRQAGKTWIMREVFSKFQQDSRFDVVIMPLQNLCDIADVNDAVQFIAPELMEMLGLDNPGVNTLKDFHLLFKREILHKPLILVLDEFDALPEPVIAKLVSFFRNIYLIRLRICRARSAVTVSTFVNCCGDMSSICRPIGSGC